LSLLTIALDSPLLLFHCAQQGVTEHTQWLEPLTIDSTPKGQRRLSNLSFVESLSGDMEQDMNVHHHIAKSQKDPMNIYSYVYANQGDPAFMVCYTFGYRVLCLKLINISDSYQN
jgi:hypothetical protein